ncbi:DUF167 family protein, partial [Klebsiella pneumoniae]|uniref:DUF167 family protein n=1 Tax=Klebsiella pneumoniae TaxID=573 RepID=UPI0035C01AF0
MILRTRTAFQLTLHIQPKASRDSIVGVHGDELKVAITAPPVDGQAAEMIFRAQRPQASCDEQNRQHRDAGYGETP